MKKLITTIALAILALLLGVALFGCDSSRTSGLPAPQNLRIDGELLLWDEVDGAEYYIVGIDGAEYETSVNEFNFSSYVQDDKEYTLRVMAINDKFESDWSDELLGYLMLYKLRVVDGAFIIRSAGADRLIGTVVIPARVDSVSVDAVDVSSFYNCNNVTSFTLSVGLRKIEKNAFEGCSSLTKVFIPSTVTEIAGNAFSKCPKLTEIIVDENNPIFKSDGNCIIRKSDNMLIADCENSVVPDYIEGIGDYVFYQATFTEYDIPKNVKSIGDHAFEYSDINAIVVPSYVESIGEYAFSSCDKLEQAIIQNGVQSIGKYAFSRCNKLSEIVFPGSIAVLSERVCYECSKLEKIAIGDGVKRVEDYAFGFFRAGDIITGRRLQMVVTLPVTVAEVGKYAFSYCLIYCGNNLDRSYFNDCTIACDDGMPYVYAVKPYNMRTYSGIRLPIRDGYKFCGWAAEEGGKITCENTWYPDTLYISDEFDEYWITLTRNDVKDVTEDTVWYAVWEKDEQAA